MNPRFEPNDFQILVVDDDIHIVDLMRLYLENSRFRVVSAQQASEAFACLATHTVHLVVLDIMLPDMDGWTLCQRLREIGDVPVLMVTAKGERRDKLQGFQLGADDYLVKPFDPNELVARITSLLRRTYQPRVNLAAKKLRFGHLCIDTASHSAIIHDKPVLLTPREYQLLHIFAEHPNHVLARQQLLDLVWGMDYDGDDRVVDVFVKRLREKLRQSAHSEVWTIATVRGSGYKFKVED